MDTVLAKRAAERLKILYGKIKNLGDTIDSLTPPSLLITEKRYPKVNIGILASKDKVMDDFSYIDDRKTTVEDIVLQRLSMINLRTVFDAYIPKKSNRLYESIVESELSIKEVDIEAKVKKLQTLDNINTLTEYGIRAYIRSLKINSNPKIPNNVYKIIYDDIPARNGVIMLYNKKFSDYYISRLFSLGVLGNFHQRKLVPSKWSITAVQKIIIDHLKQKLEDYNQLSNVYIFKKEFFGNIFFILVKPGNLNVELIEAIMPGSAYNKDGNNYIIGRDEESGGYYSSILSSYEFLDSIKKKADVIVFRLVTNKYHTPLGVWVVREGTKRAFRNGIEKYQSISDALDSLNKRLRLYGLTVYKLLKHSNIYKQKTLIEFINK